MQRRKSSRSDRPWTPSRRTVLATMTAAGVGIAAPAAVARNSGPSKTRSAAEVIVDPSAARQTIRGFGGMNHTAWIDDLTPAQRDTAFGNEDGQLGFSLLRIPIHEDRSIWSQEVATAQRAIEHGATVFASPWNPPEEMVETFDRGDQSDAKRLRHDRYDAYAGHLNEFVAFMRDDDVDLHAVSVQNEPDYAHDWTWWTTDEMVRFLVENAGSIDTRVIAPESFQYVKSVSDPILENAEALANLDILGAHLYGTAYEDFGYPLFREKGADKELWMTEVYHPNSDEDSADRWPEALEVGEHIHHAMVDGEFQTYVWWYIRRFYGPIREDGEISKRGANMGHFSKFVRPGYVRIDATANPAADVHTSAYRSDDESRIVIVVVNKGTSTVTQPFVLQDANVSTAAPWRTDATVNLGPIDPIDVTDGSFTADLPPESVTTFVLE